MLNVATWIIIGLLAGMAVNLFSAKDKKFAYGTVFAGLVGSFVGGIVYSALNTGAIARSIDPVSYFVAGIGALGLLFLVWALLKNENGQGETI